MPIQIDTSKIEAEMEKGAVQSAVAALRAAPTSPNGFAVMSSAALVFLLRKAGYSEQGEPLQHN